MCWLSIYVDYYFHSWCLNLQILSDEKTELEVKSFFLFFELKSTVNSNSYVGSHGHLT